MPLLEMPHFQMKVFKMRVTVAFFNLNKMRNFENGKQDLSKCHFFKIEFSKQGLQLPLGLVDLWQMKEDE